MVWFQAMRTSVSCVLLLQGIADKEEVLEHRQLFQSFKLNPVLDLVVRHVQHLRAMRHNDTGSTCNRYLQLLQDADALELVDLVVRDPQLLERVCDRFLPRMSRCGTIAAPYQAGNGLDIVAAER